MVGRRYFQHQGNRCPVQTCVIVQGFLNIFVMVNQFVALLHQANVNYTVSQKNVPPLQLAIIFTCTVRLRQFLAQMLLSKQAIKMYFIFPPHLTSASALPGETENPEIASFHLNAACFFTKKTRNTVTNITGSELNHPSLSK